MSLIIRSGLLRPSLQSKLRIAFTLLSAPLFGVEGLGQQKEEQIIGDWYGVPNEVATGSPSNAFLEVKDTYLEELVIDIFNELNTKLEEGELSSENVSEVIQRQCARYDWEQLRKEAAQLTKPQSLPEPKLPAGAGYREIRGNADRVYWCLSLANMPFASREDWNSIAKGWIKEHLRVTFGH